jgi:hypothetical protein
MAAIPGSKLGRRFMRPVTPENRKEKGQRRLQTYIDQKS